MGREPPESTREATAASEFAADFVLSDVPTDRIDDASLIVADSLGAIIGGSTAPYVAEFAELSADTRRGDASILGTDLETSADRAALINGSAGSVLEVDEGHKYCAGHPAMHVLPAVFAEAESRSDPTGTEFLTAFVAGYEVGARVGIACTPLADAYHMHGVWGTVGAAVGVGKLREYDQPDLLAAMRIAANHALHTSFDAALEGATVRNSYTGMSAMNGILAADKAAAGFSGLESGLSRHLDRMTADGFDERAVAAELGDRWEFTRGYFKVHAACRYTHGALDALDALEADHEFDREDVDSVLVETYPAASRLQTSRPTTDLQAKFSIPFAVATRLVNGHSGKSAFSADALCAETYELADRVEVRTTDEYRTLVPDARPTRVTIQLTDGRTLTAEIRHAKGDAANPFSRDELRSKFERLVEPVLGDQTADLWRAATRLPDASPAAVLERATQ